MAFSLLQNWPKLSELLDAALELPEENRLAWLDSLVVEDAELKAQLRKLLTSSRPETFLHKRLDFSAVLLEDAQYFRQFEVELQADKLIGPYRLIRELGHGGMGTVWLAQRVDGKFKREVALKFPYAGPRQRQLTERLLRERDILASLQHANIARLYDADVTATGQPFLVLEYIDGVVINDYCDQHRLDIRQRLMLFQQVLSAVRYAHTHLVIHRDLKPSNILITADGVAHLLDFGIAASLADGEVQETPLTQFGGYVLTPEYASPEQIVRATVTTASDVYALGVVLYELLTGTSPYQCHEHRSQLEEAIANADVTLPSRAIISHETAARHNTKRQNLSKALRGELDTLLLKALKKDIDARYASVDAFSQDIARYLEHQPILAQPDSQWYRIKKFSQRNQIAVTSFGAILLALITGTGIALWQTHIASQQRDRAVALATRGEAVTEFMRLMITETADVDEPITMQTLLARAEEVASKTFAGNADQETAVLEVLGEYYLTLNRSALAHEAFTKALSLSANNSDPALKARLNCGLGRAFYQMGNTAAARASIDAALATATDYPEVQAICLQARAYLAYDIDDMNGMLKDIKLAQDKLRDSGVNQPVLAAALLSDFANGELELGHIADAEHDYASAIEQLTRLGRGDQSLAMQIQNDWSGADSYAGNPRGALEHLDKAREIARKRGVDKDEGAGFAANRAAQLHKLARYAEALQEYRIGIESAEKNHDASDIAATKLGMARTLLAVGRTAEAEQLMQQVNSMIGKELPVDSTAARTVSLLYGLLALTQQRYTDAINNFSQNIDTLIAHKEFNGGLLYVLYLRGESYLGANNLAAALTDATQAHKMALTFQGALSFSKTNGESSLLLAEIESKRNQPGIAHTWALLAYQQLQGSLGDEHPTTLEAKQLLGKLQAAH